MFEFLIHVTLHTVQELDIDFSPGMLLPMQLALNVISKLANWLCFQPTSIPMIKGLCSKVVYQNIFSWQFIKMKSM